MRLKSKHKIPTILYSWPALVILTGVAVLLVLGVVNLIPKLQHTAENKAVAETRFSELEAQEENLSQEINQLQTRAGVEESIRENYGLAKEGEEVVVIVNQEQTADNQENTRERGSFWEFLRNIFSQSEELE